MKSLLRINNIKLNTQINYTQSTLKSKRKVFLFGGQGTHEKGMLNQYSHQAEFVKKIQSQLGIQFLQIGTTDSKNQINQTHITQPLLVLSHYLDFKNKKYHQYLNRSDFMIGHSLGEFSALALANCISLIDALKLVKRRGELMTQCTKQPHGMLIIKYKKTDQAKVFDIINKFNMQIACHNAETNIIVPGKIDEITNLNNQLKKIKVGSMKLPVSTAFHCKMLKNMEDSFKKQLDSVKIKQPTCRILRNIDCKVYQNQNEIRQGLLKQLTNPVKFYQSILKIIEFENLDITNNEKIKENLDFIQIGGKKHITKFVEQILSCKL